MISSLEDAAWLTEFDEFDLLAAIDEFLGRHHRNWETPSELLGLHYGNGTRCPACDGRLVMRLPRIYSGRLAPGGPIADLAGKPLSVQTRLMGIGLRTSFVRENLDESPVSS